MDVIPSESVGIATGVMLADLMALLVSKGVLEREEVSAMLDDCKLRNIEVAEETTKPEINRGAALMIDVVQQIFFSNKRVLRGIHSQEE